MKNNSMTNLAFAPTQFNTSNVAESDTFNIRNQAAVLDCDPYQFLDTLDQEITRSPVTARVRAALSSPLSLN